MSMNHRQFATITAGLLARKGDAAPSVDTLPQRPSILTASTISTLAAPRPAAQAPRPHQTQPTRRMVLVLSTEDYERLGIAAVKHDETRHQILRAAVKEYLDRMSCAHDCSCMSATCSRSESSTVAFRAVPVASDERGIACAAPPHSAE